MMSVTVGKGETGGTWRAPPAASLVDEAWRAKMRSWRCSGSPSAYLLTSTSASSPALVLLLGSGEGSALATRTVASPAFSQRYFARVLDHDELRRGVVERLGDFLGDASDQIEAEVGTPYLAQPDSLPLYDFTGMIGISGVRKGCAHFTAPGSMLRELLLA